MRTPESPLYLLSMRPKIFQATELHDLREQRLACIMHHPGLFKPGSIGNRKPETQILDTHEPIKNRVNTRYAVC